MHFFDPGEFVNVFLGQSWQEVAPSSELNDPFKHLLHPSCIEIPPVLRPYVPGGQASHVVFSILSL